MQFTACTRVEDEILDMISRSDSPADAATKTAGDILICHEPLTSHLTRVNKR